MIRQFVIKLNKACNLRCPYCYYINDDTTNYGSRISLSNLLNFLSLYADYSSRNGFVGAVVFHGGEPLLMGKRYFTSVLQHESIKNGRLLPILQTNGVLLDDEWADLLCSANVEVGISLDGPQATNDAGRPDVKGRSTYHKTISAIKRLQQRNMDVGVLSVINPDFNGEDIFRHHVDLGVKNMDFLLPMHCWSTVDNSSYSQTSITKYLTEAFLAWYVNDDPSVKVRLFWTIVRRIAGTHEGYFPLGADRWNEFAVLEPDGMVSMLEELSEIDRHLGTSFYSTGMNIYHNSLDEIETQIETFWSNISSKNRPTKCLSCDMNGICNSGNYASRYNGLNFDNPGLHCETLYSISDLANSLWMRNGLTPSPTTKRAEGEKYVFTT